MFPDSVRWLTSAVLMFAHFAAAAQPSPDGFSTEQVTVRLISDSATVAPGQTIYLGLEQKIIPHWHTYWKNPGDSGTSTTIAWTLPSGVTASDIIWPAPSRFDLGPITNYGYSDQVVLLTKLTVPASQAIGSEIPVEAKASWLVCEETCIPQDATLRITLAVEATTSASNEHKQIIDAALKKIPQSVKWPATYQRQDGKLQAR